MLLFCQILKDKGRVEGRPGESLKPMDFDALKSKLVEDHGKTVRDVDVMSAALYPKVTAEYLDFKERYGPVDALDTKLFLVGPKVAQECEVLKFRPFSQTSPCFNAPVSKDHIVLPLSFCLSAQT